MRAGFSILEMLAALAVLALGASLVTVRASVALDQMSAHAAHLELQTRLAELRRSAFAAESPLTVLAVRGEEDGPAAVVLAAPEGWTLAFDHPLTLSPGGACGVADLELSRQGRKPVKLTTRDGACGLLRLS